MNNYFKELIAEETQLLKEEKWIIDAINKIKQQRNALQIERMHLESIRGEQKVEEYKRVDLKAPNPPSGVGTSSTSSTSNMQQPIQEPIDLDSKDCNTEELNLNVSDPVLAEKIAKTLEVADIEAMDSEEDENDDDFDDEDYNIDINMFMDMAKE